jgi:hypothetical protein
MASGGRRCERLRRLAVVRGRCVRQIAAGGASGRRDTRRQRPPLTLRRRARWCQVRITRSGWQPSDYLPSHATRGKIVSVAKGTTFGLTAAVPGLAGGPARAWAPAFSVELALCADGAVQESLRGIFTTQIEAPALRRLDPEASALEATEWDCRDRGFGAVFLHRLFGGWDSRSMEVVTGRVQRLWIPWKMWKRPAPSNCMGHAAMPHVPESEAPSNRPCRHRSRRSVRWADPRMRPPEEPAH